MSRAPQSLEGELRPATALHRATRWTTYQNTSSWLKTIPSWPSCSRSAWSGLGFSVTCAYDGATAAEAARQESFDLVITDYQMPKMSGEELCEAIRTDSINREVPIVLCSAKGLEIDSTRMNEVHRLAKVFHKPFSPGEVVTFACSLLEFAPARG